MFSYKQDRKTSKYYQTSNVVKVFQFLFKNKERNKTVVVHPPCPKLHYDLRNSH